MKLKLLMLGVSAIFITVSFGKYQKKIIGISGLLLVILGWSTALQ